MNRRPESATHVRLHPPVVRGGRLSVAWEQDPPSRFQRRTQWYIEYHRLDLERMDRRLLMEVVLALQLRVWAAEGREVVVHLPEPVGRITLDFWRALLRAEHVRFEGPVDEQTSYRPFPVRQGRVARTLARAARRPLRERRHRVAVTYGGGKDSTLAYRALLEDRDPADVVAVHLTQLYTLGNQARGDGLARSRDVVLAGLGDLGEAATVQTGATDLLASFDRTRRTHLPHILLYTAGLLPALLVHDIGEVVFSRTAVGYRTVQGPDGPVPANPTGRPEHLAYLRRYLRQVTGYDIAAESTHYALTELVSFRTLLHAYPEAFGSMVMCASTLESRRFCQNCTKCLEFAVFALAEGHVAPDLDYAALFGSDPVQQILAAAREQRGTRTEHGTGPWHPALGSATHFAAWCHTLSRIDPQDPALDLPDIVRADLTELVGHWGHPFPETVTLEQGAVRAAGPLGRAVAGVAARHHTVQDDPGRTALIKDQRVGFDHHAAMPTPGLDAWALRWGIRPLPDVDHRGVRRG